MRENVSNITLLAPHPFCLSMSMYISCAKVDREGRSRTFLLFSLSLSSYLLAARPDTLLKAKAVEEEDDDDDGERGQRKSRPAGCHLFLSRTDVVCQMGVFHH